MSEFKRATDIFTAFTQHHIERIRGLEDAKAREELGTPTLSTSKNKEQNSVSGSIEKPRITVFDADHARKILQVNPEATFEEIRKSYEKFLVESDPLNFDPKSPEYNRRIMIQKVVHRAYIMLTEEYSITVKRFQSLELD